MLGAPKRWCAASAGLCQAASGDLYVGETSLASLPATKLANHCQEAQRTVISRVVCDRELRKMSSPCVHPSRRACRYPCYGSRSLAGVVQGHPGPHTDRALAVWGWGDGLHAL